MHYELTELPSESLQQELKDKLWEYEQASNPSLTHESSDKVFMVSLRDEDGMLQAGLTANCYWDGLEINELWVDSAHRGKGIGSELIRRAEMYGIGNGAGVAFLKTVDAKEFYEKLGYSVFGELMGRPRGTVLYHMNKSL